MLDFLTRLIPGRRPCLRCARAAAQLARTQRELDAERRMSAQLRRALTADQLEARTGAKVHIVERFVPAGARRRPLRRARE